MRLLTTAAAIGASIGCVIALSAVSYYNSSAQSGVQEHRQREQQRQQDMMRGFNLFIPDEIEWKEGPPSLPSGAEMALLEGDPSKEGPFVFRLKAPDGYRIMPHTHPKVERVTVISGVFHLGMGARFDDDGATRLPAGTYGYWPEGMVHYAWTEGETVIQLHGEGPWSIEYVNPQDDPRYGQGR